MSDNENVMRKVKVEKLTLNFGAGKDQVLLKKGERLIKQITNIDPVRTVTQKRIPGWGLRPGLPIGCKLTLRGKAAEDVLNRLLQAKGMRLAPSCFDNEGSVSFGIHEYIDIPGTKYDPEIGIIGIQASVTLARPGFRVKQRKIRPRRIHKTHRISREDAVAFMKEAFGVVVGEEE
ncbi:50S ribosomal protein L5 [Candidatus Woesearchaeota archaeon]|nr:MAG: 50S ribosomal protein L5 [Candidatus Woesearchaeota archaeon]